MRPTEHCLPQLLSVMADHFLALKMEETLVMLLLCSISVVQAQAQAPLYPALFVFGDSLVDSGNNNYIALSLAKADLFPNGIDFPTRTATGRFCNGRTSFDVLSKFSFTSIDKVECRNINHDSSTVGSIIHS